MGVDIACAWDGFFPCAGGKGAACEERETGAVVGSAVGGTDWANGALVDAEGGCSDCMEATLSKFGTRRKPIRDKEDNRED